MGTESLHIHQIDESQSGESSYMGDKWLHTFSGRPRHGATIERRHASSISPKRVRVETLSLLLDFVSLVLFFPVPFYFFVTPNDTLFRTGRIRYRCFVYGHWHIDVCFIINTWLPAVIVYL